MLCIWKHVEQYVLPWIILHQNSKFQNTMLGNVSIMPWEYFPLRTTFLASWLVHICDLIIHHLQFTVLYITLNLSKTGSESHQWRRPPMRTSAKCKMVWKSSLNDSSCSEQRHWSFQKLPEAPQRAECKTMCFSGALRVHSSAPQHFWSSGTEYNTILTSMKLSSECYKVMPLCWSNFGAAGTTTLASKMILVHLEPDSPWVIIYNVYIE